MADMGLLSALFSSTISRASAVTNTTQQTKNKNENGTWVVMLLDGRRVEARMCDEMGGISISALDMQEIGIFFLGLYDGGFFVCLFGIGRSFSDSSLRFERTKLLKNALCAISASVSIMLVNIKRPKHKRYLH